MKYRSQESCESTLYRIYRHTFGLNIWACCKWYWLDTGVILSIVAWLCPMCACLLITGQGIQHCNIVTIDTSSTAIRSHILITSETTSLWCLVKQIIKGQLSTQSGRTCCEIIRHVYVALLDTWDSGHIPNIVDTTLANWCYVRCSAIRDVTSTRTTLENWCYVISSDVTSK